MTYTPIHTHGVYVYEIIPGPPGGLMCWRGSGLIRYGFVDSAQALFQMLA